MAKKLLSLRKEPEQKRSQETMENIFRATAHILEKEGYEKTSTNKIAAKAGVSIGSLYQYFPTKESILALMMEKYMEDQIRTINKILEEKDSSDLKGTIRTIIVAMLESKRKNRRFTKMFAQNIFGFNKMDLLKRVDHHAIQLMKAHVEPFKNEIRTENLDLTLYMIIQSVKLIPVSLMFQDDFDLNDPKVDEELVHLAYQYLKK